MATKTSAYVDTSALIAFLDQSDSYHALFAQHFATPPTLVTTSLVIVEGHGWFLRRFDAARALQFLQFIASCRALDIVSIGTKELDAATRYLRKFSDQSLTLVDACGLWLMKQRALRSCWSTDRHLALTGVPLLIHE